jgi:ABC-2 type transport system permease protein
MRKVWVIIRREFVERVRSKWFVIGTTLGPVLMGAMIVLPIVLAGQGVARRSIVVVDATSGEVGRQLVELLGQAGLVRSTRVAALPADVSRAADSLALDVGFEAIDGFLIITDATVDSGRAEYRGSNAASLGDMRLLQAAVRQVVVAERLRRLGVDPDVVTRAEVSVALATVTIRGGEVTGESGEATFLLAQVVWFLLYLSIALYGVQVMSSVVEEKTTRMVEVLVSSVEPFRLLAGKIVGVGAVGLLQMGIWGVCGKLVLDYRLGLLRLLGGKGEAAAAAFGTLAMPEVPVDMILVSLSYFLLGYFLYAAMFAAVAAMVNSETEARQAQIPVVILLMVPSVLMVGILTEPSGSLARVLSQIPFTSPIAMPVRWASAPVPVAELGGSLALLAAAVLGTVWIAGRIYRVGILMYGKKPGLREIVRWVKG